MVRANKRSFQVLLKATCLLPHLQVVMTSRSWPLTAAQTLAHHLTHPTPSSRTNLPHLQDGDDVALLAAGGGVGAGVHLGRVAAQRLGAETACRH